MAYSRRGLERRNGDAYGSSARVNQYCHEIRSELESKHATSHAVSHKTNLAVESAQSPAAKAFYSLGGYDRNKLAEELKGSGEYAGIQRLLAIEAAKNSFQQKQEATSPKEGTPSKVISGRHTSKLAQTIENEQEHHRQTYGTDGTLKPNSIGSNVRVFWKGLEIERIHYAALHVPWSYVGVLRDEAANGNQEGGFLHVNLDQIADDEGDEGVLFPEDFNSIFEAVFREHFVPLVHEQFNLKGARPDGLPSDISDCFKLLVIAERLNAKLMEVVFDHMAHAIENCSDPERPSQGISYKLVKISLGFCKRPRPASRQTKIVQKAIESLVSQIPQSLPALEDLIKLSAENQRADMAVWLFRHTNAHYTDVAKLNEEMLWDSTQDYVGELKAKLEETKSSNHLDLLVNFMSSYKQQALSPTSETCVAQAGAGFNQGIILEKIVQGLSTGPRVVRCCGNFLQWTKPWKTAFRVPDKHIKRENIVSVDLEENDVLRRTIRIVTNRHPIYLSFRASDTETCLACLAALRQWLGRTYVQELPEEPIQVPVQIGAPPPPPPFIPEKPEYLKGAELADREEAEQERINSEMRMQAIPPPPPMQTKQRRVKKRSALL